VNHPFTAVNERSCIAEHLEPDLVEASTESELERIERHRLQIHEAHQDYLFQTLPDRFERESQNLARLTGWDINDIRYRISEEVPQPSPSIWRIRYPRRPDRVPD
jgi:hypothetical protein